MKSPSCTFSRLSIAAAFVLLAACGDDDPAATSATSEVTSTATNPGEPPQVEGGPPHFTAGMFQEVVVE